MQMTLNRIVRRQLSTELGMVKLDAKKGGRGDVGGVNRDGPVRGRGKRWFNVEEKKMDAHALPC